MKAKINWIREISEKDKEKASMLFDWTQKDKWDLDELHPSGNRNLYFKLNEPIKSNGIKFNFLKLKGHHYMKSKKMHPPEAEAHKGEHGGNPAYILILRKNPSVPEGTIEHKIEYKDYTLYLMKTYERPNGCMFLEEVLNEVKIQNHLIENSGFCPLPIGIVKYDKKFENKEIGAHVMAIPERDVRIASAMEDFLDQKISNKYKSKLISYAVEMHFNGLRKLHENNVAHMYAHFANSVLYSKHKPLFYCDFENSVLLRKNDKEYNKLYKAIDLSEAFCRIYTLTNDLRKMEKIDGDFFAPAIRGYGFPKEEGKRISFILNEKTFGSFIKFYAFNLCMAYETKDLIK
jgi:hypothetical protein